MYLGQKSTDAQQYVGADKTESSTDYSGNKT